ncbi:MAG: hypothetical protein FIB06_03450 [Betaproteobacteria bacterium]|nr:hypothetical protein [Betaproteobacteria bacterium]
MNLPDNLLGEEWYWAAWAVWALLFARSVRMADWSRLRDSSALNVWAGMAVLLVLVWSLKAGVRPGLSLHLVGATLFTLCFGRALAFIGLSLVAAGVALNGDIDPFAFALNTLLTAGTGIWVSNRVYRLVDGHLPDNLFIYVFVNGFFGSALAICAIGGVLTIFLAALGVYSWDYLAAEYLPYFLLLAFSEAWISGMLLTLFVVYRPRWVATFDDARYLANK